MTLGDGKRKVLMLLDEYSSGGALTEDTDINNKMNDFFDMAQKDMANYARILKITEIELDGEDTELPERFRSYYRVWKNGKRGKKYPIIGGKMKTAGEYGKITLEYFADPQTISMNTPDTYEFEVSEDAANCLPFYVAAQQLDTDLVVDYQVFWNMYLQHRALVSTSIETGGSSTVKQTMWR